MALQDFTVYTEVDPGNKITETALRTAWTALGHNNISYVYKDFTAAFFGGDFTFTLRVNTSLAVNGGLIFNWMVANALNGATPLRDASESYIGVFINKSASPDELRIFLTESDGGAQYNTTKIVIELDTIYYLLITRDETVGTYGTVYLSVYTDEARVNQVSGTVSIALHSSKKDYRYLYSCVTENNPVHGSTQRLTGYTENMKMYNITAGYVVEYPEERDIGGGVQRVTGLVHVYDRVQNIYDLEFQLGEVSVDKMPLVEGVIAEIPPPPVGPTGLPALAPPGVMGITDPNIAIPPFVLPSVPRPDGSKPTIPGLPRPFPELPPIEKPGQIPRLEPKEGLPGLLRPFPELPPIEKPGMVPKFEAPFSKRGRGLSGVETPQERRARLLGRVGIGTATSPTGGETEQEKRARLLGEVGIGG